MVTKLTYDSFLANTIEVFLLSFCMFSTSLSCLQACNSHPYIKICKVHLLGFYVNLVKSSYIIISS